MLRRIWCVHHADPLQFVPSVGFRLHFLHRNRERALALLQETLQSTVWKDTQRLHTIVAEVQRLLSISTSVHRVPLPCISLPHPHRAMTNASGQMV